jgi:hypothetical protein
MVSAYSEHDAEPTVEEEPISTGSRAQSASGSGGFRAHQRRAVPIMQQLIANGYQPLTIVPPAAEPPGLLDEQQRKRFLASRGKVPGWYDGRQWGNLADWTSWRPREAHFEQIATWPLEPNIGLITGGLLGADIDVRDPDLARHILAEGQRRFRGAPSRYGARPKGLLAVRAAAPIRKLQTVGYIRTEGEKPHKVEILATGQQFVAFGRHPSGSPYLWDGASPLEVPLAELPTVTEAELADYLTWCDEQFRRHGYQPATRFGRGTRARRPKGNRVKGERQIRMPLEEALGIVRALPNPDLDRDSWVALAHAIVGAVGRKPEELGEAFVELSCRSEQWGDDEPAARRLWDSIEPATVELDARALRGFAWQLAGEAWVGDTPPALSRQPVEAAREALAREIGAAMSQLCNDVLLRSLGLVEAGPRGAELALAIKADLGLGKSEAVLRAIVHQVEADPSLRVLYVTGTHQVGAEKAQRLNELAGRRIAARWVGMEREDPRDTSRKACLLAAIAVKATAAGVKLSSICARCRHHPKVAGPEAGCWARQQLGAAVPNVIVAASALLTHAAPKEMHRKDASGVELPPVDLVIADDANVLQWIKGGGSEPRDELIEVALEVIGQPAPPPKDGNVVEAAQIAAANEAARQIAEVLRKLTPAEGGTVPLAPIRAILGPYPSITLHTLKTATRTRQQKVKAADLLSNDAAVREAALQAVEHNCLVFWVATFWGMLDDALRGSAASLLPAAEDDDPFAFPEPLPPPGRTSARIKLATTRSGARVVRLAWPAKIAPSWRVPMLWLDGTLHEGVVRRWMPHLSVVTDIRAEEAPGTVHRIVVVDRVVGKRTLDPSVAAQKWAAAAATERREDVARLARRLAFAHAPVGLITFQDVERVLAEALSEDIARDAVRLGHFNNVRLSRTFGASEAVQEPRCG